MSKSVTTSITISFQSNDSSAILKAEIDARPDGYNGGVTQFSEGDEPVFLLYKSGNVKVLEIISSEGSVVKLATGTHKVEEELTFVKSKSASLGYPLNSGFQVLDSSSGNYSILGNSVVAAKLMVAVVKVQYFVKFDAYKIKATSGQRSVLVYIEGESS